MLLLTLKRQDFAQILLLENCAKYCLDPDPELKLFQSWNRTLGWAVIVNVQECS
jgi:hypothetical protein